ncbi:MAG: hypothetical protein ACR2QF_15595, partial [Geminicoccaceae bacterium]
MNASSNPFALIGLLGNGLLSASVSGPGNLAQPSEGGEASFVDSLSAALATSLALPVPATADQAATGLGMFAASLAGGVAAGEGHLPTGDAALDPARLPLLPGAEPEMVEGLSKSLTPTLHRPAGPERPMQEMMPLSTVGKPSMLGEPAILGEGGAKAGTGSDIVENLQRQVGSRAVPLTAPSQTRMPGQPMTGASANEPSSSNAVAAPRPMPINSSQASAIAIASTTAPSTSANMPAGSVLPQQRPNLPRSADRPSAGGVDGNPVLQPVAERPAESAKPMSPVDHLRPSEQGIRNPLPNPSFGHQAQVQFTTDDV